MSKMSPNSPIRVAHPIDLLTFVQGETVFVAEHDKFRY